MSSKPSIPRQRGAYTKIWYLLLPLIGYPLLLVAAHDPLHVFSDFRRYIRPAAFAFPYEEQLLAIVFAIIFMAGFALLFLVRQQLRFVIFGTIATAVFYPAVQYIVIEYDTYTGRLAAGGFSPGNSGFLMFLATGFATIATTLALPGVRLDLRVPRPAPSFGAGVLFFAVGYGVLAIAYVYPLVRIFVEISPNISRARWAQLYEPVAKPFFSTPTQSLSFMCALLFAGLLSVALIRRNRLEFSLVAAAVTCALNSVAVYVLTKTPLHPAAKTCNAADSSLCLLYLEYGWIFVSSFVLSVFILQLIPRYSNWAWPRSS
jgi:hypothetical protein